MLNALSHGWTAFLARFLLTTAGLWVGVGGARRYQVSIRSILGLVLVTFPVLFVGLIAWMVIYELDVNFFRRLGELATALFALAFLFGVGTLTAVILARRTPRDTVKRGTVLQGAWVRPHRRKGSGALTLAGQSIPSPDETKHFKVIGTTGTGKSTAIREFLGGALDRGDRAVIADPDGSYRQRFFDPARGDLILNPFDRLAARWDLFAEIAQPHDADQLARSLIPDYEGGERNWRHYARTFLTAILRQLHRIDEHDPARLYYLLLMAEAQELRELLEATPAGPFLASDNGKFFESVRSVTAVHAAAIEHVAAQTTGELLSVRKWIRDGRGVLFLPYRASEVASLRHLISTWMRLAIFEAMDSGQTDQRLWFVVDELDALGAIDGLKDALARLRKFGGRCVLGFQSIAQVRGTYGDAEAQTLVENCGNTLILRCSASERGGTSEFASRLIGKREIIRQQKTRNTGLFGGGSAAKNSITEQHVTEEAVMASEIEQLPDFEAF